MRLFYKIVGSVILLSQFVSNVGSTSTGSSYSGSRSSWSSGWSSHK